MRLVLCHILFHISILVPHMSSFYMLDRIGEGVLICNYQFGSDSLSLRPSHVYSQLCMA
jgi:hypothetical protein